MLPLSVTGSVTAVCAAKALQAGGTEHAITVSGATVCPQLSASLHAAVIAVHLPPVPQEMLWLFSGLCEIFATDDGAGGAAAEAGPLFHYLTPAVVMGGGFMQPS